MTDAISFTIPGPPRGKGQRSGSMKNRFKDAQTRTYEATVQVLAQQAMAGRAPIEGPVRLTVTAIFPIPKSWSNKKQIAATFGEVLPTVRPDHSNIVKAIEDGCNRIVWRDDAQVCRHGTLHGKYYGPADRVGVHVMVEAI